MNINKLLLASAIFLSPISAYCSDPFPSESTVEDTNPIQNRLIDAQDENHIVMDTSCKEREGEISFTDLAFDLRANIYKEYLSASDLRKLSLTSKSFGQDICNASQGIKALRMKIDSLVLNLRGRYKSPYSKEDCLEAIRNPIGIVSGVALYGHHIFENSDLILDQKVLETLLNNNAIKRVILTNAVLDEDIFMSVLYESNYKGRLSSLTLIGCNIPNDCGVMVARNKKIKHLVIAACKSQHTSSSILVDNKRRWTYYDEDKFNNLFPLIWSCGLVENIERKFVDTIIALSNHEHIDLRLARTLLNYVKDRAEGRAGLLCLPESLEKFLRSRMPIALRELREYLNNIDHHLDDENQRLLQINQDTRSAIKVIAQVINGTSKSILLREGMLVSDLTEQLGGESHPFSLVFAGKCLFDSRAYRNLNTERLSLPVQLQEGHRVHYVKNYRGGPLIPDVKNNLLDVE